MFTLGQNLTILDLTRCTHLPSDFRVMGKIRSIRTNGVCVIIHSRECGQSGTTIQLDPANSNKTFDLPSNVTAYSLSRCSDDLEIR